MVERSRVPARSVPPQSNQPATNGRRPSAVLFDGSALYMAARTLYENRQLDYHGFIRLLTTKTGVRPPGPNSRWVMWTSASAQNAGQTRFLDFAEHELQWEVRRVNPADSYIVEPSLIMDASQGT